MLAVTVAAGYLGAYIMEKIRMPVPYMIGSMLGVALLNIVFKESYLPSFSKVVAQSVSGCFIGLSLTRNDLKGIRQLFAPALVLVCFFLLFTGIMGLTLSGLFHLDKATAFLVAIPGGVTEVSLMAAEFGAEPSTVSFIQTFRLFTVYMIFPAMISFFSRRVPREEVEALQLEEDTIRKDTFIDRIMPDSMILRQIITVSIAIIGGFLGKASGIPAGTLSFAILFTIGLNLNCKKAVLERKYKKFAQLLSGCLIGRSMTAAMILNIRNLLLPTAVLMSGYIITNILLSYLMSKTRKIDFISAMFASSPGGASDMALIATELGGESPKIAILQIVRLLTCYTIFPLWSKLLLHLFA